MGAVMSSANALGVGEASINGWAGPSDLFVGGNGIKIQNTNSLPAGSATYANVNTGIEITSPQSVVIVGDNNGNSPGDQGVRIYSNGAADARLVLEGSNSALTSAGTTTINGAATNINVSGAGDVTIGNANNTTSLNSATNNIGHTNFATVNNIGNSTATSQVNAQAGNAKMTLANNSAVLTVPSGANNVNNGVAVDNTKASITGGTTSPTRMTMTDNAATFSRVSNGAPITVTGVADGKNDFDAVNVRQFAGAVAAVAAQANIPALAAGQDKTVGVGVGNFMGKTGLALGMNLRGEGNTTYKLSVSTGLNGGAKTVIGAGAAWAF